jgi:hypothetical protein
MVLYNEKVGILKYFHDVFFRIKILVHCPFWYYSKYVPDTR